MVGLLSAAEIAEIRGAVKLVSDTFMITPIIYYREMGSTDPNMEDNVNEAFKIYNLKALVEFAVGNEKDNTIKFNEGSFDYGDVTLTLNIEDVQAAGLIDNEFMPQNSTERDYFKCMGKLYKVIDTALDGPLEQKQVLVLISGELYQKTKNFTNIIP